MIYALINIIALLVSEALPNHLLLFKTCLIDHTAQLSLLKLLLNLTERKFYRIVLWTVRNNPYPLDAELFHQVLNCVSFMCGQVIHYNCNLLSCINFMQFSNKINENGLIDSSVV